jgi:hypothetical protein
MSRTPAALIAAAVRPFAAPFTTFIAAYLGSSVALYLEGTFGAPGALAAPAYLAVLGLFLSIVVAPSGRALRSHPERFSRPVMAYGIRRQSASAWIFGGFAALASFRNVPPSGAAARSLVSSYAWIEVGLCCLALVVAYLKVAANWAARESEENPASGPALAAVLSVAAVWTSSLAVAAVFAALLQIPALRAWCEPLLTVPEERLRALIGQRNFDLSRILSLCAASARMACVPVALGLLGSALARVFPAIGVPLFEKALEASSRGQPGPSGIGRQAPSPGAARAGARGPDPAFKDATRLYGRFLALDEVRGGTTCSFYRAWDMREGRPCGIKVSTRPLDLGLPASGPAGGEPARSIKPADCLREIVVSLACPPVSTLAGFHEVFLDGDRLVSVVEYAPGPTLYRLFKGVPRSERLDYKLGCLVDIAIALDFFRAGKFDVSFFREFDVAGSGRDLYHGDLHAENVIIRHDGHPVLIDWGASYRIGEKRSLHPSTAPEFLAAHEDHERLGSAADVYSLGAMLWHLAVSEAPFGPGSYRGTGNEVDEDLVRRGSFNAPDCPVPGRLVEYAKRMLSWRAGDRPSMSETIAELKGMMGRPHTPGVLIMASPDAEDLGRIMRPRLESAAAFIENEGIRARLDRETVGRLADLVRRAGNAYLGKGAAKMTARMTPFLDPEVAATLSRESLNGMRDIDSTIKAALPGAGMGGLAPAILALRKQARASVDGGAGNFWDALLAALIPNARPEELEPAAESIAEAFALSGDDPLCLRFTLDFLESPGLIERFPEVSLRAGLLIERIVGKRVEALRENRWIALLSRARVLLVRAWAAMREGSRSEALAPMMDGDRLARAFELSVAEFAVYEGRSYSDFSFLLHEGRTLFLALSPAPRPVLASVDPLKAARRALEALRACVDAWGIPSSSAAQITGDLYAMIGGMADTEPSPFWDRMHADYVALFHDLRETFFTLPFSCLPPTASTAEARALYLKWKRGFESELPAGSCPATRDIDAVLGCVRADRASEALAAMSAIEARGSEAPGLAGIIPACRLNALYMLDREAEMLSLGHVARGNGGDALAYTLLAKASLKAGLHDEAIEWDLLAMDSALSRCDWRNYLDALLNSRHVEHDRMSRSGAARLPAETMFDSLATWTSRDAIEKLCRNELPTSFEKVHEPVFESFREAFPRVRGA